MNHIVDTSRHFKAIENQYLDSFIEVESTPIRSNGFDLSFWSDLSNRQREEINEVMDFFVSEIKELEGKLNPKPVNLFESMWDIVRADVANREILQTNNFKSY